MACTQNKVIPGNPQRSEGYWGTDETSRRAFLWDEAAERAGLRGWVYVFDADHELIGISPEDFRELCRAEYVNTWGFRLYDCWDSDRQHRVDGYWQAWAIPRVWLAKAKPTNDFEPQWDAPKGIHVGHIPPNYPLQSGIAPGLAGIRHLSYVRKTHRLHKYRQYLRLVGE